MRTTVLPLILLGTLVFLSACDSETSSKDPYLDNLDDTSYANRRDKSYPAADGQALYFADFAGDFVWVDFAAPWCPPCAPQAQVIRRLEYTTPGVAFVTMVTSDREPMSAATESTARAWAGRFRLDPARVAACGETRVIPSHMLFSPEGQLLYWSEGTHSMAQIQAVLSEEIPQWTPQAGYTTR